MSDYRSNLTLNQVAAQLKEAETFLLTTHAKPDGDAIGSMVALSEALEAMGKKVQRWVMPPLPKPLKVLTEGLKLHYYADATNPPPEGEPQRIVVLDTGSWAQLKPLQPWLKTRNERITVIDHHLHGNDVGRSIYTDPTSAATAQIIHRLIGLLGAQPSLRALEAMYVGVASDTGWFRFSNTT
ncbi:MAG: DHH family phosphoesterase, partial [Phycisphaeraceae bacterium]|nr:DHH family phosphoesterase [Phycisphaeraceae bacterium]